MDLSQLSFRTTDRTCHCKVCDRVIERNGEKIIVFKTWRGHSDPVHICLNCLDKMNELVDKDK